LLEAGFLYSRLLHYGKANDAKEIDEKVGAFLSVIKRKYDKDKIQTIRGELVSLVTQTWEIHFQLSQSLTI
jgi:hypothetical protein